MHGHLEAWGQGIPLLGHSSVLNVISSKCVISYYKQNDPALQPWHALLVFLYDLSSCSPFSVRDQLDKLLLYLHWIKADEYSWNIMYIEQYKEMKLPFRSTNTKQVIPNSQVLHLKKTDSLFHAAIRCQ